MRVLFVCCGDEKGKKALLRLLKSFMNTSLNIHVRERIEFFVCVSPSLLPCYVLVFIEALIFILQRQSQLCPPSIKHPMCVCFLSLKCKDAKNELFVSCRMFLRTFFEFQLFVAANV